MWPALLSIYQRLSARRMFARWAPIYEEEVTENSYSAADRVAAVALPLLVKTGVDNPNIADIGIGTGLLAQQLYDALPCRITGLDFTEDMMAVCASREITELLIKCDVGKADWPLEDTAFDLVAASGLMEYMTLEMLRHFLKESRRVLKQNGLLVFTYLPLYAGENHIRLWQGHSGTYLICGYQPENMAALVVQNGFDLVEHSEAFEGCIFHDGSSYDYRLIAARKA